MKEFIDYWEEGPMYWVQSPNEDGSARDYRKFKLPVLTLFGGLAPAILKQFLPDELKKEFKGFGSLKL